MKVLFICKSNFGRSQIAEALFNSISKKHTATSAGTEKGRVIGHTLKEFPEHAHLFTCMDELRLDLREKKAKLLTPKMARDTDKIIVMAEKETWPDYLRKSGKVVFWNIGDMCGQSLETYRKTRNRLKSFIERLVRKMDDEEL